MNKSLVKSLMKSLNRRQKVTMCEIRVCIILFCVEFGKKTCLVIFYSCVDVP